MLSGKEIEFIIENSNANTSKLLLGASKYPDVDVKLCVNCIESRQKIASKLPNWHSNPALVYPFPLSAEQCSSEATGEYKKSVIKGIISGCREECTPAVAGRSKPNGLNLCCGADLTGGMGVDSWFLSQLCSSFHYFERNSELCRATEYNFRKLDASNIAVHNIEIDNENISHLPGAPYDFIFIDPARRSKTDKANKVISLQDYEPNLIELKEKLFQQAPIIVAKVSPMADIKLNLNLLPETGEIHIVSVDNECKELLFILKRDKREEEPKIIATNISSKRTASETVSRNGEESLISKSKIFEFSFAEEDGAKSTFSTQLGSYLYEPNKSILKAGAFKLVSERFNAPKLAPSTHLYTSDSLIEEFPGKIYLVEECIPFSKKTIKEVASKYPKADLTARNFPLDTNAVKKLSGIKDGGEKHIFATTLNSSEKIIIIASLRK